MAEAILRHLGGGRFTAHSAGSKPAGFIHPLAVQTLSAMGIPLGNMESKSWDEFAANEKPIDVVITLCDSAAKEPCPNFPGTKFKAHWSLPDPAFHVGDDSERAAFALLVGQRIHAKIEGLLRVDWTAPPDEVTKRLRFLGEI
jgi:arsenate reductase